MKVLMEVARFLYANRASAEAVVAIVLTAFLFNSPAPGEPLTRKTLYAWVRSSLFSIANARHIQPPEGGAVPKQ